MEYLKIKEIDLNNKPKTKLEFLIFYFKNRQPATYYVENDELQCKSGKRRSLSDLLQLVKYYYPLTSKKGLIRELEKVALEVPVRGLFCDATNKVVFFYDVNKTSSKLFSSINYNSDTIHRKKIGDDNLSMDLLESWMLNDINTK